MKILIFAKQFLRTPSKWRPWQELCLPYPRYTTVSNMNSHKFFRLIHSPAARNNATSTQIELCSTINRWNFYQISECQAPLLKTFWRLFCRFTRHNRHDSSSAGRNERAFEYVDIDKIVGMRLDQLSYWDSCKLVGRPWSYQHEIPLGE